MRLDAEALLNEFRHERCCPARRGRTFRRGTDGGTIYLAAESITSSGGMLRANGGGGEVGGGGGRIAVYCTAGLSDIGGLAAVAAGGTAGRPGSAGSVYFNSGYSPPPEGIFSAVEPAGGGGKQYTVTGIRIRPDGSVVILWDSTSAGGKLQELNAVQSPGLVVEYSRDLLQPNWIPLTDQVFGNSWTGYPPSQELKGFFRIRNQE